jgi:hypothetical protein
MGTSDRASDVVIGLRRSGDVKITSTCSVAVQINRGVAAYFGQPTEAMSFELAVSTFY